MADAEQLARKKKVRRGHRASTTRVLGQVQPSITTETLDIPKVTQLKRSLKEKLHSLSTLDKEILPLTPEEEIVVQADEIKERVYTSFSRLELALEPVPTAVVRADTPADDPHTVGRRPLTEDPPTEDPPTEEVLDSLTVTGVDAVTTGATLGAKVKLPKISLLRFNGDPVKWTPFWDSYKAAVHSNPRLCDVDKFNYLRSLLDHTAFDSIAGLTLSTANYQEAIAVLQKRFGNKQIIISKHMDNLLTMNTISSDRNLKELRQLYDHTEAHVRSLRSLGIEAASYGALLSSILLSKLPPDLRLIVSRKVSDTNLDMDALLSTFEEELTARESQSPASPSEPREITSYFLYPVLWFP